MGTVMVAETSREAYKSLRDLGDKQRVVYEAIKTLGRATDLEIANYLGKPINTVTNRRGELLKYDMVAQSGHKINPSGNKAMAWVIKDLNDSVLKKQFKPTYEAVPWMEDDE